MRMIKKPTFFSSISNSLSESAQEFLKSDLNEITNIKLEEQNLQQTKKKWNIFKYVLAESSFKRMIVQNDLSLYLFGDSFPIESSSESAARRIE